jgi:membrane protein implicated in regulation of membrane protease activity
VGGLEAVAFGLLPMRFLAGQALYRWSRPLWAVLFGLGTFSFSYLLIGPHSGYLSELPLSGLIAAFGVFAMFGTVSVLFWGYFRFRRERTEAT